MDTETLKMLKKLTFEEKLCEPIQHALKVRKSLSTGNYGRFFKMFRTAPNMGAYLMDIFIEKHRVLASIRLSMAYIATNIDLGYISHFLGFDREKEAETFFTSHGNEVFSFYYEYRLLFSQRCRRKVEVDMQGQFVIIEESPIED